MTTSTVSALQLRDYQDEAVAAVFAAHEKGVHRGVLHLATGLGKTACAMGIIRRFNTETQWMRGDAPRVLFIVHSDELVQQTLKAISLWLPDFRGDPSDPLGNRDRVGVVKAERNDVNSYFVVASVQTLAVASRLQQLLDSQVDYGPFGLVIADEAHLAAAPSWVRTLEGLGSRKGAGPLLVGLTATPNRSDGVGLKVVFDEIVYSRDIVWGIANGHLVPPVGITVKVDLSEVKISRGDYTDGSLSDVLELDGAHIAIARLIQEHVPDRKTIVFTPTVRFAGLVADECVKAGIVAEMVSGETPLPERRQMYERLRLGETRVIVNCNVLQEGFDEPSVDAIVNARPTRSPTTFTQRVGRGLRPYPGKKDCVVVALAGSERNRLASLASLAGRTWEQAMKAREAAAEDDELFDFAAEFDELVRDEAERAKMKTRSVDLLSAVRKKITWAVIDEHCFAKSIPLDIDPRHACVIVKEDWRQTGWRVVGAWKRDGRWVHKRLLSDVDFSTAQGFADDLIRQRIPNELLDSKARWRREAASVGQLSALSKWQVKHDGFLTKGEASDLLDAATLRTVSISA